MRKPLAIAVMTLLGTTAFAAGEVYRWKDANGVWTYSDQPHPGAELVRRQPGSSTTATPATPAAATPAALPPPASEMLPVTKEVAHEVRTEAAAAKIKACEQAKVEYEKRITSQRIYRLDAKGNRVFMTDAEIDAARLEARAARDAACGT